MGRSSQCRWQLEFPSPSRGEGSKGEGETNEVAKKTSRKLAIQLPSSLFQIAISILVYLSNRRFQIPFLDLALGKVDISRSSVSGKALDNTVLDRDIAAGGEHGKFGTIDANCRQISTCAFQLKVRAFRNIADRDVAAIGSQIKPGCPGT